MDQDSVTSDSEEELFPIEDVDEIFSAFDYADPLLSTGILRAVQQNDLVKIKELVRSGKSVNINDNVGNTPLHLAVFNDNLEILDFLLNQDEIVVNARNFLGETPLFRAAKFGKLKQAEMLITFKANVNLPNFQDMTPLHVAVNHPDCALLLINNFANIDAIDYSGDTPLHEAVWRGCTETVSMLLYYNANANIVGGNDLTPFARALLNDREEMEEILLNYTVFEHDEDFCILDHALRHGCSHVEHIVDEIVKNGNCIHVSHLILCVELDTNHKYFKKIWDNLIPTNELSLDLLLSLLPNGSLQNFVNDIISSRNIDLLLSVFRSPFCDKFINFISKDSLSKLVFHVLEWSGRLHTEDLETLHFHFGNDNFLQTLIYMENTGVWFPNFVITQLIFNINSNIHSISKMVTASYTPSSRYKSPTFKHSLESCLELFCDRNLQKLYFKEFSEEARNNFPTVPSLTELSRNECRNMILKQSKAKNSCQYYTWIDHELDVADIHKKILKFQVKLYEEKIT